MDEAAVGRLQQLLRHRTVATKDRALTDHAAFAAFQADLRRLFPRLFAAVETTEVGDHGLLLRWPGHDSTADPVVLMAHQDVVPVEDESRWQHPAWGAELIDGVVWGRGTLDDKAALVGLCEAVETLIGEGVVPARDVWLSFGADEEIDGQSARAAVEFLRSRGVQPWFVLDEGGAVAEGAFPGVAAPLAVIGVAEKGTTSIELHVAGRGGHASTPARKGPVARLARALTLIDDSPMPTRLPDTVVEMMTRMAPHARGPIALLLRSAERARPLLARALIVAGPETAAMTRTTFALTTLQGSPAHNVIAAGATAGVNIRVMVGDTVEQALAHVKQVVADRRVEIRVLERGEPSPVSPLDAAFELIEGTVGAVFPDAVATPYVQTGATDSRFFTAICPRVYRFTPFRMSKEQRASLHSHDERIGAADYLDGVRWYRALIEGLPA